MRAIRVIVGSLVALALSATPAGAVVGGQVVPAGEFGYVANVKIFGHAGCTGVLLAPQWVITAGHCGSITGALSEGLVPTQATFPPGAYTVTLGTINADGSGGETYAVTQVVEDPDYVVTNGVGNDVSLLRLSAPSTITPMQIASDEPSLWAGGVEATIAGFGTTSQSAATPPPQMRYAQIPFVTDAYCASKYTAGLEEFPDDGYFDPKTMICAGGLPRGGVDVCEGDSGGPLLAAGPGGQPELIGTTSFGRGCAQPGYPSAYALVAAGLIRVFVEQHIPQAFAPATVTSTAQHHKHKHKRHRKKRRRVRRGLGASSPRETITTARNSY